MGQGKSQWNPEVEQIQIEQTIKPVLRVRSILGKSAAENYFQTSCNIFQGVYSTKTVRPLLQNTSPSHHNKSHCAESKRHTRASKILYSSFRLWNTVNFKVNNQHKNTFASICDSAISYSLSGATCTIQCSAGIRRLSCSYKRTLSYDIRPRLQPPLLLCQQYLRKFPRPMPDDERQEKKKSCLNWRTGTKDHQRGPSAHYNRLLYSDFSRQWRKHSSPPYFQ